MALGKVTLGPWKGYRQGLHWAFVGKHGEEGMGKKKQMLLRLFQWYQTMPKSLTPKFKFLLKARSLCDQMFLRGRKLIAY